jgi:hypothetical protein
LLPLDPADIADGRQLAEKKTRHGRFDETRNRLEKGNKTKEKKSKNMGK